MGYIIRRYKNHSRIVFSEQEKAGFPIKNRIWKCKEKGRWDVPVVVRVCMFYPSTILFEAETFLYCFNKPVKTKRTCKTDV
ncbi:MAG TPA: hypothetical protein DIW27_07640, partial [Cytophagales bacterium]|nr:hypothetical protein [Cytophagales bacterium]